MSRQTRKTATPMVHISSKVTAPVDIFTARRVRHGKTKRDRESGATARRFTNRAERLAWQSSKNPTLADFPFHVCNGKKNRSLKTVGVNAAGACIQKYVAPTRWMNRRIAGGNRA